MTLSFTIFLDKKILIEPICFFKFYAALSRFSIPHILMKSRILSCFQEADLSKYKDSMRPLIERDMTETKKALIE